jgi:hypothetical protein
MMKIKRLTIFMPEYNCYTSKPVYARFLVLFNAHKLLKLRKVQLTMNDVPCCKPVWMLAFPKVKYIKCSSEQMKLIKAADAL